MSHKKRAASAFKSMGAAGLAAATILSGLSFGIPAASAVPKSGTHAVEMPIIISNGSQYLALAGGPGYWGNMYQSFSSEAAAVAGAKRFGVTAQGNGWYSLANDPTTWGWSRCAELFSPGSTAVYTMAGCSAGDTNQQFRAEGSKLVSRTGGVLGGLATYRHASGNTFVGIGIEAGWSLVGDISPISNTSPLTANVASVNNIAKSAVVSGTATPKETVEIGSQTVTVEDDGTWSITVTGLKHGPNELTVIQKVNGVQFDSKNVTATLNTEVTPGLVHQIEKQPVTLDRGGDKDLPVIVEFTERTESAPGTVTFTAPAGTTFATGRDTLTAQYRDGGFTEWHDAVDGWDLTNGQRSADGTTYTYTFAGTGKVITAGGDIRWAPKVSTPANAAAGDGSMSFTMSGTMNNKYYAADGSIDTTIEVAEPDFTADGTFSDDVSENATIAGAAQPGATVTLYHDGIVVDTTVASQDDGSYAFSVAAPGAGKQTFEVSQTPVGGSESDKLPVELQYGAGVEVSSPTAGAVTPGDVTVVGTGTPGALVTITAGAQKETATVDRDGTYEATLELPPSNDVTDVTASQHSKGNLITTSTVQVTANGEQQRRDVVFTTPTNRAYVPLENTTVGGTATPYAKIEVRNQWGTIVGRPTADKNGVWAFDRVYGPAADYQLEATQTRFDGSVQTTGGFRLSPIGAFRSLQVSSPSNPGLYTPGEDLTIRGSATPGAVITAVNQWNTKVFEVRANQVDGTWSATRQWGPTAEYVLRISQRALDGTRDEINGFTLKPQIANVDMTVNSDDDGDAYKPGNHVFTGTGTPTATVTAKNQWGTEIGRTKVLDDGSWTFDRHLGPTADYDITFTQTRGDTKIDDLTLRLVAPAFQPLVLEKPAVGQGYRPGVTEEWAGTASPFAQVTVVSSLGTPIGDVEADKNGKWSFSRAFGPSREYELTVSQKPIIGDDEELPSFVYGPVSTD